MFILNFKKKLIDDAWKVDNNDHSPDSEEFEEDGESLFESGLDNNVDINENKRIRVIMYNHINRISTNFKNYCSQTPVLGFKFNSSKYDINLVKNKLTKLLGMHDKKLTYAIKRNNYYTCIATPRFRFLDMNQFIAPRNIVCKIFKSVWSKGRKGFFPIRMV